MVRSEGRKSKRDKKAKRRHRVYKKGGQHRSLDIDYTIKKQDKKKKKK